MISVEIVFPIVLQSFLLLPPPPVGEPLSEMCLGQTGLWHHPAYLWSVLRTLYKSWWRQTWRDCSDDTPSLSLPPKDPISISQYKTIFSPFYSNRKIKLSLSQLLLLYTQFVNTYPQCWMEYILLSIILSCQREFRGWGHGAIIYACPAEPRT